MNEDTFSRESSFDSISTYDADDLVPPQISPPPKFDEKIIDFVNCICCCNNKRNN